GRAEGVVDAVGKPRSGEVQSAHSAINQFDVLEVIAADRVVHDLAEAQVFAQLGRVGRIDQHRVIEVDANRLRQAGRQEQTAFVGGGAERQGLSQHHAPGVVCALVEDQVVTGPPNA